MGKNSESNRRINLNWDATSINIKQKLRLSISVWLQVSWIYLLTCDFHKNLYFHGEKECNTQSKIQKKHTKLYILTLWTVLTLLFFWIFGWYSLSVKMQTTTETVWVWSMAPLQGGWHTGAASAHHTSPALIPRLFYEYMLLECTHNVVGYCLAELSNEKEMG